MNSPLTTGRPAVPWIVVTPDSDVERQRRVRLQGAAQLETRTAGSTAPLTTRRWRWSSSERPQSFERSVGSIGELKKFSPTLFIDFESVYDTL